MMLVASSGLILAVRYCEGRLVNEKEVGGRGGRGLESCGNVGTYGMNLDVVCQILCLDG